MRTGAGRQRGRPFVRPVSHRRTRSTNVRASIRPQHRHDRLDFPAHDACLRAFPASPAPPIGGAICVAAALPQTD
jgi:hypothetical protein